MMINISATIAYFLEYSICLILVAHLSISSKYVQDWGQNNLPFFSLLIFSCCRCLVTAVDLSLPFFHSSVARRKFLKASVWDWGLAIFAYRISSSVVSHSLVFVSDCCHLASPRYPQDVMVCCISRVFKSICLRSREGLSLVSPCRRRVNYSGLEY